LPSADTATRSGSDPPGISLKNFRAFRSTTPMPSARLSGGGRALINAGTRDGRSTQRDVEQRAHLGQGRAAAACQRNGRQDFSLVATSTHAQVAAALVGDIEVGLAIALLRWPPVSASAEPAVERPTRRRARLATRHPLSPTSAARGDLSVVDVATKKVLATIALGKRPRGSALSPDGALLYVALSGSPIAGPGVD